MIYSFFLCFLFILYSDKHLQLLFTILQTAPEPFIRSNIVISLGDLAFRFPNLIEPWTGSIYSRLKDKDTKVRKNTLMVLAHLILNDMIKVILSSSIYYPLLSSMQGTTNSISILFTHLLSYLSIPTVDQRTNQ